MSIKDTNNRLENIMEDLGYDAWLERQADEYNDPHTVEVTIEGYSYFDILAKSSNGEVIEMNNVPLSVYKTIDVTDEDEYSGRTHIPRWSEICDDIEDYFDVNNLNNYEIYVEDIDENELLPEGYELIEVKGFADGHSFEDLEIK